MWNIRSSPFNIVHSAVWGAADRTVNTMWKTQALAACKQIGSYLAVVPVVLLWTWQLSDQPCTRVEKWTTLQAFHHRNNINPFISYFLRRKYFCLPKENRLIKTHNTHNFLWIRLFFVRIRIKGANSATLLQCNPAGVLSPFPPIFKNKLFYSWSCEKKLFVFHSHTCLLVWLVAAPDEGGDQVEAGRDNELKQEDDMAELCVTRQWLFWEKNRLTLSNIRIFDGF